MDRLEEIVKFPGATGCLGNSHRVCGKGKGTLGLHRAAEERRFCTAILVDACKHGFEGVDGAKEMAAWSDSQ